jgi:hypothetical protein
MFLGNRTARRFLLAYTLLLHVLVLGVVYALATREACTHDHDVATALARPAAANDSGAQG